MPSTSITTAIMVLTAERYLEALVAEPAAAPLPAGPTATQAKFARELSEHGHGRRSRNPFEIPWAGWKDILWRTYERINDDRLLATAAGVVFFGLLADPSAIGANLQTLALMLPEGSFQIVQDQISRVLA